MFTGVVDPTLKSLNEAEKNIETIISGICHKQWAKEVVEKHGFGAASILGTE